MEYGIRYMVYGIRYTVLGICYNELEIIAAYYALNKGPTFFKSL
jgi:hypothetical protein